MTDKPLDPRMVFTTRQTAHALGLSAQQVRSMISQGEIHPAWQWPGGRGDYLFERAEIERVLALSTRRQFKRRRVTTRAKYPMNGLQPVEHQPRKRRLPAPPE